MFEAKLSEYQVKEILAWYKKGEHGRGLIATAQKFGVPVETVRYQLRKRRDKEGRQTVVSDKPAAPPQEIGQGIPVTDEDIKDEFCQIFDSWTKPEQQAYCRSVMEAVGIEEGGNAPAPSPTLDLNGVRAALRTFSPQDKELVLRAIGFGVVAQFVQKEREAQSRPLPTPITGY